MWKMAKRELSSKTLLYSYDPDETYTYNTKHGTVYPYHGFPTGLHGIKFKKTRFIDWEPIPEDIIMRHSGSQIFVNFEALFPDGVKDPVIDIFQLRAKRLDLQNYICEQINFFTALYDDDNDLLTSMLVAKYLTDSESYTIETFDEYYTELFDILFPNETMRKIKTMVEENDVGDVTVGLFPLDFLRDMYIASFMIKVMHIFIEHFIIGTGNSPKDMYLLFAKAFKYAMDKINPNMYVLLFNYVAKNVAQNSTSIDEMQAIEGNTTPTTIQFVVKKSILCDGLIKLTFASAWDKLQKRPVNSCVGLIKAVVNHAVSLDKKRQLRFALVNVDDPAQLLSDTVNSSSPISMIRSFNPGEFCCMLKDLNIIIAHIALEIDTSPVEFYMEHMPQMNDLSKILIDTVLYNKFHSSISTSVLGTKQKYLILLYVRKLIMDIYGLTEEDTISNPLINILMGKTVSQATRSLTQKDLNGIKKYIKLNNLKEYLLSEKNVNIFVENIMHCVLSSYTIVNHNDPSLLDTQLIYESGNMTLALLDTVVELFELMK